MKKTNTYQQKLVHAGFEIGLLIKGIDGILEIILLLWRRKLWAYPLSIVSLVLFIAYQIYRYTFTHSMWLVFLSVFDLIMILLTYLEYNRMKQERILNNSGKKQS